MSAAMRCADGSTHASVSNHGVMSASATRGARGRGVRGPVSRAASPASTSATCGLISAHARNCGVRGVGSWATPSLAPSLVSARRNAMSGHLNQRARTHAIAEPGESVGSHDSGIDSQNVEDKIGVLLLNLGGPEKLEDVQPFLYNLFADPDIIRLPAALGWLQSPLAALLSANRAPKSREAYASIGGGSPLRRITDEQADAIAQAMSRKGEPNTKVYVGMRYWKPFTEDAVEAIKADGITKLIVLPLYPQFSISTSGSSLRLLEQMFSDDDYLQEKLQHTVIPSWYQRPGYVKSMAQLIKGELNNKSRNFLSDDKPVIFFSAHGVPVSYVESAGDPYKEEMERCVGLIVDELKEIGVDNEHVLAYQSRVGPVEWLKPYTDDVIRDMGEKQGVKAMVAVPVSFVSEHIETLEEIDMEYRELAEESGIKRWGRVPALDTDRTFIDDLADACLESLAGMRGEKTNNNPDEKYASAYNKASDKKTFSVSMIPPVPTMPAGSGGSDEVPTVGDLLGVKPEPWRWGPLEFAFVAVSILLSTMLLMDTDTGAGLNETLFK